MVSKAESEVWGIKKNKLNTTKEYFKKLRRCNNVQLLGTET